MKHNKIYSLILAISVLIFSGCNDTKENPAPPDSVYSFFNATTPLEIKKSVVDENGTVIENGSYTVAVQLLKHGLVEPGEIVQMLPFDLKYGFVTDIVVETTTNGYAVFTYVPPEGSDYDDIRGHDVTIEAVYEDLSENVNVVVDEDAPPVILLTQDFLLQFR